MIAWSVEDAPEFLPEDHQPTPQPQLVGDHSYVEMPCNRAPLAPSIRYPFVHFWWNSEASMWNPHWVMYVPRLSVVAAMFMQVTWAEPEESPRKTQNLHSASIWNLHWILYVPAFSWPPCLFRLSPCQLHAVSLRTISSLTVAKTMTVQPTQLTPAKPPILQSAPEPCK